LIDENGQNIGVIATPKALDMAREQGLDLVEVSPLAQPPVARIVNYSKMRYEEEKSQRKEKSKQKKIEIKGIRLSLRISDNDTAVRLKQAEKFLGQEDKVRVELILRGREKQHFGKARDIINKFVDSLNATMPVVTEQPLNMQGGKLSILLAKK